VYCLTGSAAASLFAISHAPFPISAPPAAWAALVTLALGPTAMAGVLYVWLVQRAGPVFTSMGTYLTPVWAMFLGFMFLGETPGLVETAALTLILAGVWLANSRRMPQRPR
jgi:drug/metabolite transporter (DMT)-like permease